MKNGSLILFSSNDIAGCIIKCFSKCNSVPNDLKLTHAGILIKASEKQLYELTGKNYYCKTSEIEQYFVLESTGSVDQIVNDGIAPCVQINRLQDLLADYNGRIYVRQPFTEFQFSVAEYLDKPYNDKLGLLLSVFKANTKEQVNAFFCSQLVFDILRKQYQTLKDILPQNVIPENLGPNDKLLEDIYENIVKSLK